MEEIRYTSLCQLAELAEREELRISDVVLRQQEAESGRSRDELIEGMRLRYAVMRESAAEGCRCGELSSSGLSGGDAVRMREHAERTPSLLGAGGRKVLMRALAVSEQNARMGRICAAPTAGAAGILPAVLLSAEEEFEIPERQILESMFTASAIGMVIATVSSVSGAMGGCQAECGSASAMAAGALTELMGGGPRQVLHAVSFAIKSVLGLVCDPVAGLVEVPCVKRNGILAVEALAAAEMALAGIESRIPADEVIEAMKAVGDMIPGALRETAAGGLAATRTAAGYREKNLWQE